MKMRFLIFPGLILITFIFLLVGCQVDLPHSSSSPSASESVVKEIWDQYIVVHPFGSEIQQPHLLKLIQSGALRGVRLDVLDNPEIQHFALWFQSHGVDVLGLFENEHLRKPNVCQIFSQHVIQNPGITTWEIGNEVAGFIAMSAEEYTKIATILFYYVKQNHPNIRLAIGAVAGNGDSADEL